MKIVPVEKTEENKERDLIVCPSCKKELDKQLVVMRKYVCYECGYYFRVRAKNRIRMVADEGSFTAWLEEEATRNPLDFPNYEDKIAEVKEKTGLTEGVLIGDCTIGKFVSSLESNIVEFTPSRSITNQGRLAVIKHVTVLYDIFIRRQRINKQACT